VLRHVEGYFYDIVHTLANIPSKLR
jgi:hypothetical protein